MALTADPQFYCGHATIQTGADAETWHHLLKTAQIQVKIGEGQDRSWPSMKVRLVYAMAPSRATEFFHSP